eukprot:gene10018-13474_t
MIVILITLLLFFFANGYRKPTVHTYFVSVGSIRYLDDNINMVLKSTSSALPISSPKTNADSIEFNWDLNSPLGSESISSLYRFDKSASSYGSHINSEKNKQLEKILKDCRARVKKYSLTDINHAITTAGRMGRLSEAFELFESIPKLGHTVDLMSYNNIIWSAGNVGRADVAKKLFNELVNLNFKPNVYTYGSLMHGFAQTSDYKQALLHLEKMKASGIKPSQIVFTSAMEACAGAGKFKEALAVMDLITKQGIRPDKYMINTAIRACCYAGEMEEAEKLAE